MNCLAKEFSTCSTRQEYKYCSKHYQQVRRHGEPVLTRRDSRPAIDCGEYIKIPLGISAKDGYTLVDRDYAYLADDNWRITHYGYAVRSKDHTLLHRLITNADKGLDVDHISGDRLDNRTANLRVCTHFENCKNQALNKNNSSGFKGVTAQGRLYRARLTHNYKQIELGKFETAIDAARAYDKAAAKYCGRFARLNNV